MNEEKTSFWKKDSVRSVIASLLSILIGLLAGTLLILIVGCTNKSLGFQSAWEGIRLVFFGLFSTGRDATGALTFGFNPASMGNMLFRAWRSSAAWRRARSGARSPACSKRC